jgi:hypothetical protein
MKKLRELYVRFRWWRETRGMSALGLELRDALMTDAWIKETYTLKHERSGIELWIGESARFCKVYRVPHVHMKDEDKENALNKKDREVVHRWIKRLLDKVEATKPEQIMSVLLASRYKDD